MSSLERKAGELPQVATYGRHAVRVDFTAALPFVITDELSGAVLGRYANRDDARAVAEALQALDESRPAKLRQRLSA